MSTTLCLCPRPLLSPRKQVCNHPDLFEGRAIVSAYDMPRLSVQLPSAAVTALPDPWDCVARLGTLGLLMPRSHSEGEPAAWAVADAAALATRPAEFAAAAAEAVCAPGGGGGGGGGAIFAAGARAAHDAGLVPVQPGGGSGGAAARAAEAPAAQAAAAAADSVRAAHAQLLMASGPALTLSGVLSDAWTRHGAWRASRIAHAASLSIARCGADELLLPTPAGVHNNNSSSSSSPVVVCGDWLPRDACGVPVGHAACGRFPDAAAFASASASRSRFLPAGSAAAGTRASAPASTRMPLCGTDLVAAVQGAAHPVAACLRGRTGTRELQDLTSLVLELSVRAE